MSFATILFDILRVYALRSDQESIIRTISEQDLEKQQWLFAISIKTLK